MQPQAIPRRSAREPRCSRCGGELKRTHRSSEEARQNSDWRRYRCVEERCGWQGLLARPSRRTERRTSTSGAASPKPNMTPMWLLMGGLLLFVLLVAGAFVYMVLQPDSLPPTSTLPGSPTSSTPPPAPASQPRR
jgi:hypothetical protein